MSDPYKYLYLPSIKKKCLKNRHLDMCLCSYIGASCKHKRMCSEVSNRVLHHK